MDRRSLLQAAAAGLLGANLSRLVATPAAAQEAPATAPFTFDAVIARARALAAQPYQRPLMKLGEPFADLTYDQFRAIRFRDDKRLFAGSGSFQMEMLPPRYSFQDKIEINVVADGRVEPVAFLTDYSDFHRAFFP